MNIKISLGNVCDLVRIQFLRRGEVDTLPGHQNSRTIKHVAWGQLSLRTVFAVRVRSFAVPNYPHTFKVGGSQSCNRLRYVSIFIDPTDLKTLLNRWYGHAII
ncbi:hypothetical protein AVEN_190164-1 [Araneus ventricosus]|uniref:Uncharacterized protein n=1 Tax=Araneus ventricosus TaxID=182803 RepID=A0A4Y2Q805_ARAVE|nr:hypothetical protein AVEN_55390-1 [Araneus ventricosus]GBN58414.1 hypothetical protein AVEN_207870-1 [Araneus ventricosus]GBN58422.1 hypothetical protein AVEN_6757-1 [Araneus ventricosus]GBN58426.1 hypothetical protein AVEN_190164-1 [Araneus ventricosus]